MLAQPGLTVDLDVVIHLTIENLPKLIEFAKEEGMHPRIEDAEASARKNRVLYLRHEHSGINTNISLGILPFELEMIERGQEISVGDIQVRLHTPED